MSVSFFLLFLIVKSALWALQGMTIQKMASRDPKQTANQHQRHENSMYVYICENMYTCISITDWKKVITMDSFIIYLIRKMLNINMWKYMKYILDCAWGNIRSAAGWITHPLLDRNGINHYRTTNKKQMMGDALVCLHSALSCLWDTAHTHCLLHKLPYPFNARQHKTHITKCLRKTFPVQLYTPSHCIPNDPEVESLSKLTSQ